MGKSEDGDGEGGRNKRKGPGGPESSVVPLPVPVGWNRCNFYVEKKKRFCRMPKIGAELYCGEHVISAKGDTSIDQKDGNKRTRMVCPYDGTHSCYVHLLYKHKKICNARPRETPVFIRENLNRQNLSMESVVDSDNPDGTNKKLNCIQRLDDLSDEEYGKFLLNLVEFRQRFCPDIPIRYGFHTMMGSKLLRTDIGQNSMKHLSQTASLLKIMDTENMIQDNTCFIEYGSGTGALTFEIAAIVVEKKLKDCTFILIDKTSPRHKRDNKCTDEGISIHRIRADIKDVAIGQLPGVNEEKTQRLVGVAKHLCGSATDMALRSLFDSSLNTAYEKVAGCCFATCCHHRCESSEYPGWSFLNAAFSHEVFPALTKITSSATNGNGRARIDDNKVIGEEQLRVFKNLSATTLPNVFLHEQIGEFAKEILERGRVEYIKSLEGGRFYPGVAFYTEKWTTRENRVIFASKDSPTGEDRIASERKILEEREKINPSSIVV